MKRVLINGCTGKMGQMICSLMQNNDNLKVVAGVSLIDSLNNDFPVYESFSKVNKEVDVIIDFSNPITTFEMIDFAVQNKAGVVIGTTGHSEKQIEKINSASKLIPIFESQNMSLGVNIVKNLIIQATKLLEENFDIEIIEKHHNQKIDAPSGTAYLLANAINESLSQKANFVYNRNELTKKRDKKEIGIHSIRGGTIVGEHSVIFAGNDEIIEIKHEALSRKIFANGAISAARFIANKEPGFYEMKDLIKSIENTNN